MFVPKNRRRSNKKKNAKKTEIQTLLNKAKELLLAAIDKNDQLVELPSRHPHKIKLTEEFEIELREPSEIHENYVAKARQYIELSDETICESTFSQKTSSRASKILSISSSQKRSEQETAKLEQEEIERHNDMKSNFLKKSANRARNNQQREQELIV